MPRLSIPTKTRLSSSLRVDSSSDTARKLLNRLSRQSLISLALDWLNEELDSFSAPFLDRRKHTYDEDEDEDFYPPERSVADLRELYSDMLSQKGAKKDVVDRVLEGDWRHGLSLYQLAMADVQYLDDHPLSQKWTAYRILPLKSPTRHHTEGELLSVDRLSLTVPRFHPSTFLQNFQREVLPDVKVHYNLSRPESLDLTVLRIFILQSPYNTGLAVSGRTENGSQANLESSRTLYVAFPDGAPYIFISKPQTMGPQDLGEAKSLRSFVLDGITKALSQARERYTLKSTGLTTRNLAALLHARGASRTNYAAGGWSIYADEEKPDTPLDTVLPAAPLAEVLSDDGASLIPQKGQTKRRWSSALKKEERARKRAKVVAQARFGDSGKVDDNNGVERVDILIEDPFADQPASDDEEPEEQGLHRKPNRGRRSDIGAAFEREPGERGRRGSSNGSWVPNVRLTFHGTHVFAGMRQLVEAGIIDGERMPGWLTGEDGVTVGAVRDGRIRGNRGSGVL